ncbi:hypothetical protein Tco_0016383 [Tanacetum coccineum]
MDLLGVVRFPRWVEAEVVSSEVESEEWRRLLLHRMCGVIDVATDGREEDFFPKMESSGSIVDQVDYASRGAETLELELRSSSNEQRAHDAQWKWISDKRTKNEAKTDKIKHGMEKREKTKSNRSQSQQKSKSTPTKSTVKTGADTEEYLMDPPEPI